MQQKFITLAITGALMSSAYAQDNSAELNTIIVNSVYTVPAERDNTGSSVTVLTEKDFQQRNATYVLDVLKTVPSVAVEHNGGRGTLTTFRIRGAEADHTQVVIDGVKVNSVTSGGFNFGQLPLNDIERIEVLRGEQSALWGSDAIGGVINITTKSGKYADKPFNATINVGVGSDKTLDTNAVLYGRQGGLYYSLSASRNKTDGISARSRGTFSYPARNGTTVTTGGAVEDDQFKQTAATLRVGYEFERAGVEALIKHSNSTVDFDDSLSNEKDFQTKTKENTFKLTGYLGNHDDIVRQQLTFSNTKTNNRTEAYQTDVSTTRRVINYQADYNFDQEGATAQAVSAILEHQKENVDSSIYDNWNRRLAKANKDITHKSVAVEYRLFNNNDHALSAGVRYDRNSEFENAFTYRLAGGYRLSDNFRLHASFGTGIKNPTTNEYYGYYGEWNGNPNLKPEKSRGGELGILIEDSQKNHQLDITYFNRRLEDEIRSNYTTKQSENFSGTSKAQGVELSYNGNINNSLGLYANYTYTKTKDSSGNQLVRRPKHMANLGINYQINEAFSTTANVSYVGKRYNRSFSTWPATDIDMPAYTLVNLGANYKINKNFETYLNINNVFDKSYENLIGFGQPGRNFYLGFKGSW